MKILVAPLNWGLGHASRCIPLIQRLLDEGNEVVLAGDGDSLTLLRKHFQKLRYTYLAPLNLRYSRSSRQVLAILCALPKIIRWAIKDHILLKAILREEPFDQIISDNRFGLYLSKSPKDGLSVKRSVLCQPQAVYITHQLHIMLPKGWKWAESIASRLHARIYTRFDKVWVPDYADSENSLAGELSHPQLSTLNAKRSTLIEYIGPLSRFTKTDQKGIYDVVAVLSGLEPHRSLLEKEILGRYQDTKESVLIVQGLMGKPNTRIKRGNITIVPYMADDALVAALQGAKHIIARSGYSTIMDLAALGILLNGQLVELFPTPGQPEQEYLATRISKFK